MMLSFYLSLSLSLSLCPYMYNETPYNSTWNTLSPPPLSLILCVKYMPNRH